MIDENVMRDLQQLQKEADPQLLEVLIGMYFRTTPERIERIESAIRAKDGMAVAGLAHDLKSSSANLGVKLMRDLCFDVEEAVKRQEWSRLAELRAQLATTFLAAKKELERFLPSP